MTKLQEAIEAKKVLKDYKEDLNSRLNKRLGLDCIMTYHNHYDDIAFSYFSIDNRCSYMITESNSMLDALSDHGFTKEQKKIIMEEFRK